MSQEKSGIFSRFILPGFAFKAAVIGGGYATGRELATFFLPNGALGGIYAILTALVVWSVVCAATFLFAFETHSRDYRTFFKHLLGRLWWTYELAFFLAIVVILAVFVASAGAIGTALFGWPDIVGALLLMVLIVTVTAFGNRLVESVFRYSSFFLYGTFAVFAFLVLSQFGSQTVHAFSFQGSSSGWFADGLTFASYNIIGAIVILPVTRHFTNRGDAVLAGLLAGPMAMVPGLLFFLCMVAFIPEIMGHALPSDFLLTKLNMPVFRIIFQIMIFVALFETGIAGVNAINERIAQAYRETRGHVAPKILRIAVATIILSGSVFVAGEFGLVALVAQGYRWLAYAFLSIYVLPLLIYGIWVLSRGRGTVAGPNVVEEVEEYTS